MADEPKRSRPKKNRRGHGEGSIYQRESDGRWVATIDAGYVDGKRKRLTSYHDRRKDAAEALSDLKRRAKSFQHQTAEIKTLGQFLDHWLESTVTKTRAPKTVESYGGAIRLHISPAIGTKRLQQLNRVDVQRMLDQVARKEGVGPRTVENVRAVLSAAMNDAVKWGMIESNPAEHTTIARVVTKERTALTVEQAQTLLTEVRGDRYEAIYVLAAVYGLRRGECLGLRWSDVDDQSREIRIRQQVIVVDNQTQITPLKTKASIRTLPLLDFVSDALNRRRSAQDEERLLAGSDWQEFGLIFTSTVGTPYQPANFHKRWQAHLRHAELPMVPFHSLRHTAASFLVALNVHPRLAMEILGHSNITTTLNIYSHAQQSGMRAALESVENVLRKVENDGS
jgi:integrase